jgi:hypothetical protein
VAHYERDETRASNVTEPQIPQEVPMHLHWNAANEIPVAHVNQFVTLLGPPTKSGVRDGIYLLLGNAVPPVISAGTVEARQRFIEAAQEMGLRVDVYGRFHLSRELLSDLIDALQAVARVYDATTAESQSEVETK